MTVVGFDIDGVLTAGFDPAQWTTEDDQIVVISGRTWADYDDTCKALAAHWPVYIRGAGAYGDQLHAATFKAEMIRHLGVGRFYDDDLAQLRIIGPSCPGVELIQVGPVTLTWAEP